MFFDFLYLLIYKFYASYKEKGAASTSVSIIGGLQTLNILTLILLFELAFYQKIWVNKILVILMFIITQIYAYIRYSLNKKYSIKAIEERWLKKSKKFRERMSGFLWVYGIISVVGCFGLAIYFGGKN